MKHVDTNKKQVGNITTELQNFDDTNGSIQDLSSMQLKIIIALLDSEDRTITNFLICLIEL